MVASAQNVLKSIWTKAEWWLCTSHKLFGIGDIMKDHPSFGDLIEELYSSVSVIKVPKNNARRRRWLRLLRSKNSDVLIPPQVGETRWNAWRDAADWYIENWKVWFEFLDAEASLYPFKGLEGAKKPLLQRVAELTKKRPMGLLVRLCFISDHCAILQSALNLAQDYGTACFWYDKLMLLKDEWSTTTESETFSPRIEDPLNKLSGGGSLRSLLLQLLKKMFVAYKDRLKKESRQIEFYRQLRILNPRNLSDMPRAMDQYPLLGLSDVPEIAEQWSLYIRCNAVDINGPTALQEWWQSRAPSLFQERVLFLITQPTSGGDVERFFSQCGTVSKRQHKLDDNIRRLWFMLQFHGDIEGRLL